MVDFKRMAIFDGLPPSDHYNDRRLDIFLRLRGATVLSIGSPIESDAVEGGLVIDYKTDKGEMWRTVFGFNDLGMWVEYDAPI